MVFAIGLVPSVSDAADAFGDLRDPAHEFALPAVGDSVYRLENAGVTYVF